MSNVWSTRGRKGLITLLDGPGAAEAARMRMGWRWPVNEVVEQILMEDL